MTSFTRTTTRGKTVGIWEVHPSGNAVNDGIVYDVLTNGPNAIERTSMSQETHSLRRPYTHSLKDTCNDSERSSLLE